MPRITLTPAVAIGALLAVLAAAAHGADILDARYDPARDDIVVEIAYRGTNPDHDFTIQWDRCRAGEEGAPARVAGRLIDAQGRDVAREDYRIVDRIALDGLPCRPALVTLRLGLNAHAGVLVPRRVELMEGVPARPYDPIGPVEALGRPGEHRWYVQRELRERARALGADAVIQLEERVEPAPLPPSNAGEAPLLGNPYPGVLRNTQPGAFPQYGFDVQTGGVRYELRGLAVRYAATQ